MSPAGIAIWPRLNAPDTKFNAEGEFSAKLAMDGSAPETKAFIAMLSAVRDAEFERFKSENPKHKKATVADFWREEVDDDGEETGRVTFNFKMRHKVTAKATGKVYTLKPIILNARKEILNRPPNIGGGSTLKVSFETFPYFNAKDKEFGMSLRMIAVQIIKLVEFGGAASALAGFEEEDGDDVGDADFGEGEGEGDDGAGAAEGGAGDDGDF